MSIQASFECKHWNCTVHTRNAQYLCAGIYSHSFWLRKICVPGVARSAAHRTACGSSAFPYPHWTHAVTCYIGGDLKSMPESCAVIAKKLYNYLFICWEPEAQSDIWDMVAVCGSVLKSFQLYNFDLSIHSYMHNQVRYETQLAGRSVAAQCTEVRYHHSTIQSFDGWRFYSWTLWIHSR